MEPLIVKINGAEKYQRLLGGAPDTVNMKAGSVMLVPGESVGEHISHGREESIIILEGRAEVFCEGKKAIIADKDTLVYIPPETKHNVKNSGEGVLRYVYVVSLIK